MRKIISYQVVSGISSGLLETLVKTAISKGWSPAGGVSYSCDEAEEKYLQALVKYEEEPVKKPCHNYTE